MSKSRSYVKDIDHAKAIVAAALVGVRGYSRGQIKEAVRMLKNTPVLSESKIDKGSSNG
jgi:hypothetical protein